MSHSAAHSKLHETFIWARGTGLTQQPDGKTDVNEVIVREGKNLKEGPSPSCSEPSAG